MPYPRSRIEIGKVSSGCYIYPYIYIYVYICMYAYVYMCVYIYIHTYIHVSDGQNGSIPEATVVVCAKTPELAATVADVLVNAVC